MTNHTRAGAAHGGLEPSQGHLGLIEVSNYMALGLLSGHGKLGIAETSKIKSRKSNISTLLGPVAIWSGQIQARLC